MSLGRYFDNPILCRDHVPEAETAYRDVTSVMNPGAILHDDVFHLLLRVQTRGRETFLVHATSDDGVRFRVGARPVAVRGLERAGHTVHHLYDPRITRSDDHFLVTAAIDTDRGSRVAILTSEDLDELTFVALTGDADARNGVLFPERVGGRYLLLERPNAARGPGDPPSGDTVVLRASRDLAHWETLGEVLRGRPRFWDELLGPGPPPLRTREGWLLVYHGVATHFHGVNVYQAGAALLDFHDPLRVAARSRVNFLEPRELYELAGQVPNVVFPTGLVADALDGEGYATPESRAFLYYGAADTCVGLMTGTVGDLLAACRE